MSLYRGRTRIELEIEKNRNEGNWRKVSDLASQLNLKNISNDNLSAFLKNECSLELYLEDNAPNEKNIKKAINNLSDLKLSLINLINSNYVKTNQKDILFEAELLIAKIYYACGNEQDVLNIYSNLDLAKIWNPSNSSIRTLGLVADLFAMNERKPPSFLSSSDINYFDDRNYNGVQDGPANQVNPLGVKSPTSAISVFSTSYKRQLEKSCRDNWQAQIVSDLKIALIFGYTHLQKKYTKVSATTFGQMGPGATTVGGGLAGSNVVYGGYGLTVPTVAPSEIIGSPLVSLDETLSQRSLEKRGRDKTNKKAIVAATATAKSKGKLKKRGKKTQKGNLTPSGIPNVMSGTRIDKDIKLLESGVLPENVELSTFPLSSNLDGRNNKPDGHTVFGVYGSTNELDYESDSDGTENTYPSPPSGYILEKAFLKLPILFLKSGQILKAITVYRYQLSLTETKYTQNIRQVLSRQLIEVLMKGVSLSSYIPLEYSDSALKLDGIDRFDVQDIPLIDSSKYSLALPPKTSTTSLAASSMSKDAPGTGAFLTTSNNNTLSHLPNQSSRNQLLTIGGGRPANQLAIDALTSAFLSPSLCLASSPPDPLDRLPINARFSSATFNYPARHDLPRAFAPHFVENEILLLVLICRSLANSGAVLSLAPEHEEAKAITSEDISRINDMLTLCLTFGSSYDSSNNCLVDYNEKTAATLRRYKFLAISLERSVKFNPDRFHTWYRFAFSLYTFAMSALSTRQCYNLGASATISVLDNRTTTSHYNASTFRGSHYGDLYKALRAFEECHRMRQDNITVILYLCKICLEGLEDVDRGIEYALMAIDLCQSANTLNHSNAASPESDISNNVNVPFQQSSYTYSALNLAKGYNALGYGYFLKSRKADVAYMYPQRVRYIQLALENFKKALNLDPQNLDFAFNLALQHAILRQLPQATKLVELCLVTELNHFQACHLMGLLRTAPSFPSSTLTMGTALLRNGVGGPNNKTEKANDDFRRGGHEGTNYKQALDLIESLIQQSPHSFNLYFTRAEIETKYYGYETALITYRKMLTLWREIRDKYIEKDAEYNNLTKGCEFNNKMDVYEKETNPSVYGVPVGTGTQSGKIDPNAAISEMISSYSTHSSESSLRKHLEMSEFVAVKFQIWLKIAQLYLDQHLVEDAFFAIKEAEEVSKTSYFTLDIWGKFYMCLGDAQTAKVYFESALASNPNFIEALQDLSLAYFYLQNFEMAEIKIREALKIEPTAHKSWYFLGHIYHMNQNNYMEDPASDYYLTALDLYSSCAVRPYNILKPIF